MVSYVHNAVVQLENQRSPPVNPRVRIIALAVVSTLVASLLIPGCSREDRPPNVLLICMDTLRHDRVGYIGYPRPTSPLVDRLAAEGVVFTTAYSTSGWTLPSMATILTGEYPKDHGATDFHLSIDPRLPTLASILRDRGYDTRAFTSNLLLTSKYGFAAGFNRFNDSVLQLGPAHDTATAADISDLAIGDLDRLEEPFFMWVHYFDPHYKYLPHAPWASFGDSDSDRYDQEIAHADRHIGRLLDELAARGMEERTIVIFTSDHGEEFGEHGGEYHRTTHEEVVRVPLVIAAPSLEPGESEVIAEQIDFLPTILAMLGMEGAIEGLPGKDLFAESPRTGPIFIETDRPPRWHQRTVIDGNMKLISISERDVESLPLISRKVLSPTTNVATGTYLFDLDADPGETTDLFKEGHPEVERLRGLLASYIAGDGAEPGAVELDEATREQLRALGYIQ
jgi:arylsulfatase A-like enzyme